MLFFGAKYTIYRLRRKYDRLREKADRHLNKRERFPILKMLDSADITLEQLEEQELSIMQRNRSINSVRSSLVQAKIAYEQARFQKKQQKKQLPMQQTSPYAQRA